MLAFFSTVETKKLLSCCIPPASLRFRELYSRRLHRSRHPTTPPKIVSIPCTSGSCVILSLDAGHLSLLPPFPRARAHSPADRPVMTTTSNANMPPPSYRANLTTRQALLPRYSLCKVLFDPLCLSRSLPNPCLMRCTSRVGKMTPRQEQNDPEAESLAGVLGQCAALARLDLRSNEIGPAGDGGYERHGVVKRS